MSNDPVVLIHGAWQGAWAWDRLVPLLEEHGFQVIAADLPGNGVDGSDPADVTLDACVDYLENLIVDFDRVSVVGHSGGGVMGAALVERSPKVARMAFVAGMMLPEGRSFAEIRSEALDGSDALPGIAPNLLWSADGLVSSVPRFAAEAIFFSDCPPDLAQAASARLTPHGEGARAIRLDKVERLLDLPRLYVEASEDMSTPITVQRHMQALMPGALVAELPTGHAPQLSAPHLLAEHLVPFLTGQRDAEARQKVAELTCPERLVQLSDHPNGDYNDDQSRLSRACPAACKHGSGPCPG